MHKFFHTLFAETIFVFVFLLVGFLLGLFVYRQVSLHTKPSPPSILATYVGKLPCADCSGIDTTITLLSDHTYQESDVYEGKNTTFSQNGYWMVVKGIPSNQTVSTYQLAPYGQSNNVFYEIISETKIQQLDQNRNVISSPFSLVLTKK